MDAVQIAAALDRVSDHPIVFHGFADYARDYDVYVLADLRSGNFQECLRLRFKYCVHASVMTTLPPEVWERSLDDRLTEFDTIIEPEGHVWGVRWQNLYPGAVLRHPSADATAWSSRLGLAFHEVCIETNVHNIVLVFADLEVTTATEGTAAFVVKGRPWH